MPVRYTKTAHSVVRTKPVRVQSVQAPKRQVMPMPKPAPGTGLGSYPKPKLDKPKKIVAVPTTKPIERSNSQSVEFILKAKK